ncbi:sensor histidine kinase [Geosporobacter ferrireducens]|uniref:histidine kinase n=1 Tax=Geosporobacter ferrireducens TaxID=1424294 RepID=A0A1D8GP07_9FIRM|nr:HAMP domain-containing sensor histidine kinase [Geosporobacter ferrireducens]AOT72607.1 hypothetical protein Gferi_25470 [Geosporobacter ferrireducens]MTI55009.1 HAMP domain-containing histidine kinase [Geosporobacter ferrireducens]
MKTSLKMGMRILVLIVLLLLAYILCFGIIMILFIMVRNVFPFLRNVNVGIFRSTVLLVLGILTAYLFIWISIRPILHIIHWIQSLAQGTLQEPVMSGFLSHRDSFFYKCTQFLYKELLMQMQMLTDKLIQSETDRRMLEKNRREWLAGITHDLKTPLSYIQGYASMISADQYKWSDIELKDFGIKIEGKSTHIKNLIDDLNVSFQSEDGKVTLQKTQTEMIEFLRKIVLDIANSPRCVEYAFSYESDLETCFLDVDTILLQRALQNVLINAVVHNPPETEIRVSIKKQQNTFCIQITDNGNGMSEETRSNLFKNYYRGTSTDRPPQGSGLGMAIAKQFVELHNGTIRVESAPRKGTTILIELSIL